MYIIRNMSYSTSEKPEVLELKRFPHPFESEQAKTDTEWCPLLVLHMEARGVEQASPNSLCSLPRPM